MSSKHTASASDVTHHKAAKELACFVVDQMPREVTLEVLIELAIHYRSLIHDGELESERTRCMFFSPRQAVLDALPAELRDIADDWVTEHLAGAHWAARTLSDVQ